MGCWRSILEHWEMCSVRNNANLLNTCGTILEHWEMCSVRNYFVAPKSEIKF